VILWCSIVLSSAHDEKDWECEVKRNQSYSQFDTKFTACIVRNINFISGKGNRFGNNTTDITYDKLKVTFLESYVESVPNSLFTFSNLEILEMNQVGLRNIFSTSFQDASNLRVFHAYENKITSLDAYAFVEASKLEYLDLSHNKIANINVEAFKGLSQLKELSLIGNRIAIIDEQTFEPLKNLTWIWLDKNEIKIISLTLFGSNLNLKGINLNDNKISAFSTVLLDKLPNMRFLFLSNNNCTSNSFINTVIAGNANIKKELAACYQEYRSIVPNEEEKHQLKNVLRDAEKANAQCENAKADLLTRLESTKQQLKSLQGKNGK
jgi:hypothetical protein